jgi:DNA-binding transcriptional regulator LsrR (DeoR family)
MNQYRVNREKVVDIVYLYYFCKWTMKELAKSLRLRKSTVRRVILKQREEDRKLIEAYNLEKKDNPT